MMIMSMEQRISDMRQMVLKMADIAGQQIKDSVRSLYDHDTDTAKEVISKDAEIDSLESNIDRLCLDMMGEIINGQDLRLIAATYKFIGDLERIGDYSVSIAYVTLAVANKPIVGTILEILQMSEIATSMLKASMNAYAGDATVGITKVFDDDKEIDRLYNDVFVKGLSDVLEDPKTVTNNIYMIIASRALERIGDHITDIAERVEYAHTGKLVKRSAPMHVPAYPWDNK